MREDLLRQAEAELEERRQFNEREERRRLREMETEHPEIYRLLRQRQELVFGTMRGILKGRADSADLPERMERASAEIREKLRLAGLPEDYLAPVCTCSICGDTGYVGENIRTRCECLESIFQRKLRESLGLAGDHSETFESFNEQLFPERKAEGRSFSQREMALRVRDSCEQWANAWPRQRPRDLVLSGPSGVGKTFLLHAMAARLIERGHPALLITAYQFLDVARRSYFGEENEMGELMTAPALFLDDLGSEPMMKNITIEQVFYLINERQKANLSTVISTNLNKQQLRERYTERIASRLADRVNCTFFGIVGEDIRKWRQDDVCEERPAEEQGSPQGAERRRRPESGVR